MTLINHGIVSMEASRDSEGHREYTVTHKVETTVPYNGSTGDGPEAISSASGLPAIGDQWSFGNDSDAWAYCHPDLSIKPFGGVRQDDPISVYLVTNKFSTKPLKRCQTNEWGDPLLEPDRVSGSFVLYTKEAVKDRYGNPIMNSAHEIFRGPQVEFDSPRGQVRIEQNNATLDLPTIRAVFNHVNDDVMWGIPARSIKLNGFTWEELWYGTCTYYYKRVFTFDVCNDDDDLFDRDLLDEGTKVISGRWDETSGAWVLVNIGGASPDNTNPQHFIRYKDRNGENARVILDGKGYPANAVVTMGTGEGAGTGTDSTDDAGQIHVEKYDEADLIGATGVTSQIDFGSGT